MLVRKLKEIQETKGKQFSEIRKTIHTMNLKLIKGKKKQTKIMKMKNSIYKIKSECKSSTAARLFRGTMLDLKIMSCQLSNKTDIS